MHLPTLLHGDALDVAQELDAQDASNSELRAALTNALTRIHHIELHLSDMQDEVRALRHQVPDNR